MSTTKLDLAYSAFIMEVLPLLKDMSPSELTELLSDITKKLDYEIDGAKEVELYRSVTIDKGSIEGDKTAIVYSHTQGDTIIIDEIELSDEEIKANNAQQDILDGYADDMREEEMEDDSENTL